MIKKKWVSWLDIDEDYKDLILDANQTFMEILAVLVSSTLLGLMAYYLLAQPGGLVGVLAGVMAKTCAVTGYCEFQGLFGSLGFAITALTSFTIYTMLIIKKGEDSIDTAPAVTNGQYKGEQLEVLEKIQGLGVVESLSSFGNYLGVPYGTLHRWVKEFEEDGLVRIKSNGSGSPMRIEAV